MDQHAIVADRLTVDRGRQRVLSDVSFSVEAGEVFALLGGNGAGKSTTLLTFLGLIRPTGGDARILGRSAAADPAGVREHVAYLPERTALYDHLSARENLAYFLALAKQRLSAAAIDAGLDQVELQPQARDLTVSTYSKGMRQKVGLALALLRNAPVLLLDEPTSGLDPTAIDEFNALIGRLSGRGVTILMMTHDIHGACHAARRIGVLREGQLIGIFDAGAEGRIDPETVHRAFTGKVAA